MLKKCEDIIFGASKLLDAMAGWGIVAVMVLTVGNIFARLLLKRPILGTYELIGFFTATAMGFALAYCAVHNGHIAIGFIMQRLSPTLQKGSDIITGLISFVFLGLSTWHLGKYAYSMVLSGEVSSTAEIPFYPYIYLVSVGLFMLSLVLMIKLVRLFKKEAKV